MEEHDEQETLNEPEEKQELVTLSLHSMVGLTAKRSMKMKGRIGNKDVVVLVDSGATRNFISEKLVQDVGLAVTETRGFGVCVGNGHVIGGKANVQVCYRPFKGLISWKNFFCLSWERLMLFEDLLGWLRWEILELTGNYARLAGKFSNIGSLLEGIRH